MCGAKWNTGGLWLWNESFMMVKKMVNSESKKNITDSWQYNLIL